MEEMFRVIEPQNASSERNGIEFCFCFQFGRTLEVLSVVTRNEAAMAAMAAAEEAPIEVSWVGLARLDRRNQKQPEIVIKSN